MNAKIVFVPRISLLLAAASQNVIPDTAEAFKDLLNDLNSFGIIKTNELKRTRMYPKRSSDPDDKLDTIYRCAESAYRRMIDAARALPTLPLSTNRYINKNIRRIDYIENKKLSDDFYSTKESFRLMGISDEECFMFHGTHYTNIDSILQDNFNPNFNPTHKIKAAAYGEGIYFSEFPSVGLSYGTLILCRVLPGRVEEHSTVSLPKIPKAFDSRKVAAVGAGDHSAIHIIKHSCQILPHCVIVLEDQTVAYGPEKSSSAKLGYKQMYKKLFKSNSASKPSQPSASQASGHVWPNGQPAKEFPISSDLLQNKHSTPQTSNQRAPGSAIQAAATPSDALTNQSSIPSTASMQFGSRMSKAPKPAARINNVPDSLAGSVNWDQTGSFPLYSRPTSSPAKKLRPSVPPQKLVSGSNLPKQQQSGSVSSSANDSDKHSIVSAMEPLENFDLKSNLTQPLATPWIFSGPQSATSAFQSANDGMGLNLGTSPEPRSWPESTHSTFVGFSVGDMQSPISASLLPSPFAPHCSQVVGSISSPLISSGSIFGPGSSDQHSSSSETQTVYFKLSPELNGFVGRPVASMLECVKAVKSHISKHQLTDPLNESFFIPDATLSAIFGPSKKQISDLQNLLRHHLSPAKMR